MTNFLWMDEGLVTGGQMIVGWEVHLGQFHGRPLILQISTNLASPPPTLAPGNEKVFTIISFLIIFCCQEE